MLASPTFLLLLATTPANCPSAEALSAELDRLGTAKAVAALGTPEVSMSGTRMRVGLRGRDGSLSGVREIVAPASCGERASVAAIVVSAWVGAWPAGSFPEAVAATPATNLAARRAEPARAPEVAPLPDTPRPAAEQGKAEAEKVDAPLSIPSKPMAHAEAHPSNWPRSSTTRRPARSTFVSRTNDLGPARVLSKTACELLEPVPCWPRSCLPWLAPRDPYRD